MTFDTPLSLSQLVRRNSAALSAEIDGEAVALDVARGACYGMDPIAAHIWRLIENPVAIGSVCDTLTALYAVDEAVCRRDVLDLIEELRAAELIMVESGPSARPG
jgi:hypothetical protein